MAVILKYVTKNFWLALLPLAQGIAEKGFDFELRFGPAYTGVLVALIMLAAALIRRRLTAYEWGTDSFVYKGGFFLKTRFEIPYSKISVVTELRRLYLRPFRASVINIESEARPAAGKNRPDAVITVGIREGNEIFSKFGQKEKKESARLTYKISVGRLILFSLFFSSATSGVIYAAAFLIQGGRIVRYELERLFLTAVEGVTSTIAAIINGVTNATVALSVIIAGGWLLSFIINLLRHVRFTLTRSGRSISVECGFFTKRKYFINYDKINYADMAQNLLMKTCRVSSVHVSCMGYGKGKNEIPVFIPIISNGPAEGPMRMLLPDFKMKTIKIKAKKKYISRYVLFPLILTAGVIAAAMTAVYFFSEWSETIGFAAVMAGIASLYLIIVKTAACLTSGAGLEKNALYLKYCRFFRFHNVIIPEERIAFIKIYRSAFQRINGSCDLWVYTNSETKKKHVIRGMKFSEIVSHLKIKEAL